MSFKRIRKQTWYCTLCFRSEVENDPTNLEGISALKKSAKRRTAAVNGLVYAIFGYNELRQSLWMLFHQKIEDDAKCQTEKKINLFKFYIKWKSCKFQLVMHYKWNVAISAIAYGCFIEILILILMTITKVAFQSWASFMAFWWRDGIKINQEYNAS